MPSFKEYAASHPPERILLEQLGFGPTHQSPGRAHRKQETVAKALNAAVAEIGEHRNPLAALRGQKNDLM